MSSRQKNPPEFAHLVNLADDLTGTFVLFATDDYFAEKENLIRPDAPRWEEDKYTDKGKWMDGWESQRRRTPGHDSCIVRLGTPGLVHGVVVDTTWFRGNAPTHIAIEGIVASYTATADELNAAPASGPTSQNDGDGWFEVVPHTAVQPHTANSITLPTPSTKKATHLRLRIYPDGGVARLRVFGVVVPDERTFWRAGAVDLAAIENGGTIAAVSDEFFGPPSNLLLPGRGVNMGDGWETKRRRTPGSDWCVIKLGRRGLVERVELDTAFFKGNAPQAVVVEAIDDESPSTDKLRTLNDAAQQRGEPGWPTLIGKTPLVQHRRHILEPERPMMVTHLRVHIFPHGGVNRLRVFGSAVDRAGDVAGLAALQKATDEQWLSFCGSKSWAQAMTASVATISSARELFAAAERAFWTLGEEHLLEAFAAHPKIGETKKAASATAQSASWSSTEQAGVAAAQAATTTMLVELNQKYLEKFGFIYIVFASGKSAEMMLEILESRLANPRATELDNAAREQLKITRLRLEKHLAVHATRPGA